MISVQNINENLGCLYMGTTSKSETISSKFNEDRFTLTSINRFKKQIHTDRYIKYCTFVCNTSKEKRRSSTLLRYKQMHPDHSGGLWYNE